MRLIGSPMSSVSDRHSSSQLRSKMSAIFSSRFCRSKGVNFDHGPSKAARAAATAASTSCASARGTVASSAPVAGLRLSITSPDRAATHFPPISIGLKAPE